MRKLISTLLMLLLAGGGWLVHKKFDIKGLDKIRILPAGSNLGGEVSKNAPPIERSVDSIRIASFNIQVFGQSKLNKPQVLEVLADVVRRFDVVAVQEIRSDSQDILPRFLDVVNAPGRHYDFVIGPRLGRTTSKEQYAMIYDAQSVEVDRTAVYTVEDPDDLLHRPPLVAAFRVRGPPPDEAFTFTLINIHTDPDETTQELNALDDVFRAVRNDGRGEDDILLLGDLNVDDRHLGQLGEVSGIRYLIAGVPTNTRGTKLYDNILLHERSTIEFKGVAGVFDIMREYNLTMDQALQVSDHLPIWAEFHIYESGRSGRLAARPGAAASSR